MPEVRPDRLVGVVLVVAGRVDRGTGEFIGSVSAVKPI